MTSSKSSPLDGASEAGIVASDEGSVASMAWRLETWRSGCVADWIGTGHALKFASLEGWTGGNHALEFGSLEG